MARLPTDPPRRPPVPLVAIAFALSFALHGLLLLIRFQLPESRPAADRGLEVVLVNTRHAKAPEKAEVLAQLVEKTSPAAVLVVSGGEGKEIAGRLAVKTGSGLITDAVDVAADGTTTQSVFAGNYTVTAKVTKGTPIIAVTAKAMRADREKCILAGASDYIAKPVDMAQLLSLLRVRLAR